MSKPVKPFKATCWGEKIEIEHVRSDKWFISIKTNYGHEFMDLDTRQLRRLQRWLNEDVFGGEDG